MTKISSNSTPRRGRVFPERQLSAEEKARRRTESEAFAQRCRVIFDSVKSDLIKDHYDWFIIIEPDSGEYIIDVDKTVASQKANDKFGEKMRLMMRLNETGACGRI